MSTHESVEAHYGRGGGLRAGLEAALQAAVLDSGQLSIDELAALEEFHSLGRRASIELAERAGLRPAEGVPEPITNVVDAGAGLGGPARLLAARYGCRVVAVDLTAEYCEVAAWLNSATGLDDRVEVRQGDALQLPVEGGSADVVWTQHVQMNIADKAALYREFARVLRPGGRLALWDIVAGPRGGPIELPVPWAERAELSWLIPADDLRRHVEAAGFDVLSWDDRTADGVEFLTRALATEPPQVSLRLVVPDLRRKIENQLRNMSEGRCGLLMATATGPPAGG